MTMSSDKKQIVTLSVDDAKDCLKTILSWIRFDEDSPPPTDEAREVMKSIEQARETSENDMVALMNRVYPIIVGITAQTIATLGYTQDGSGVLEFEKSVQSLLVKDAELARLHSELRSYYLPAIVFPGPHENTHS